MNFSSVTCEQKFLTVTLSYICLFSLRRALNVNKFTGRIPPSLGKLSNLTWLDLGENQLSGTLPYSITDGSGLDQLLEAQHLSVFFVWILLLYNGTVISPLLLFFTNSLFMWFLAISTRITSRVKFQSFSVLICV